MKAVESFVRLGFARSDIRSDMKEDWTSSREIKLKSHGTLSWRMSQSRILSQQGDLFAGLNID